MIKAQSSGDVRIVCSVKRKEIRARTIRIVTIFQYTFLDFLHLLRLIIESVKSKAPTRTFHPYSKIEVETCLGGGSGPSAAIYDQK